MKVHKLYINGGQGFFLMFWIGCLSVICMPLALLMLLQRIEVTTTEE